MSISERVHSNAAHSDPQRQVQAPAQVDPVLSPDPLIQRKHSSAQHMNAQDVLQLQRLVGNQAVGQALDGGGAAQAGSVRGGVRLSSDGDVVQRFSDEPHEAIEKEALTGFSQTEMKEINFGNWQTDINQISLIKGPLKGQGIDLNDTELFELAQLLAVAKYGETIGNRMSPERMGSYKEAEHFDNPNRGAEQRAVPSYINAGISEIVINFNQALSAGRTPIGREYYGRGLHIVEDFFAHTNFVEIALKLMGKQVDIQSSVLPSGADQGRYQLTSGIFETLDTAVSMLKLIQAEIKKPTERGKISSGQKILIFLGRKKYPRLTKAYEAWLKFNQPIDKFLGVFLKPVDMLKDAVSNLIMNLIVKLSIPKMTAKTGTGAHTSHSKLNKDDESRPNFVLSKQLAVHVVGQINPLMTAAWSASGTEREAARLKLEQAVYQYLQHPDQSDWWREPVRQYMKSGGTKG